jgi:TonB family protein
VVAIKADMRLSFSSVARVLDALARARVERVVLLSSLAFEPPAGPPPGTHPGGLPGGIDLKLHRLRPEPPQRLPEATADPPAIVEPPSAEAVFDRPTAAPPTGFRGPYMVGGDVIAPVKVHAPPSEYTEIARRTKIQGVVILQVVIDERGDVTDVKVLKGLPMGLDTQAVEAVRQWKFEPATRNGEPVEVYYNLTVQFLLE